MTREFHLDPEEEARLERMVGPKGVWFQTQTFQFEFLISQGVRPSDKVLDIGCGVIRYGVRMIDYLEPGNYFGTDIRKRCIIESKAITERFGLQDKRPKLRTSKTFGREFAPQFDVITCFQLFYHLEDDLAKDLFARLKEGLTPTGAAYADINVQFGEPGKTWKRFPFLKRPLEDYREMCSKVGLQMECLGSLGELGFDAPVNGVQNPMLKITHCTD